MGTITGASNVRSDLSSLAQPSVRQQMGNPTEAPWKIAQGHASAALQEQVKFPCGKYCGDGWAAGFFCSVIYSAGKDVL